MPKAILKIDLSAFRTLSQQGFSLNKRTFGYDDPNVMDGFVYPAPSGSLYPTVNALSIPWTVKVIGTLPLVVDNPQQITLPSGITLTRNVRRLTLYDQDGLMLPNYSPVQDGILNSAAVGANAADQQASDLTAGQFLNLDGLPFGFYTLLLEADPFRQWTDPSPTPGDNPARVQFKYSNGRIDVITISPEPFVAFAARADLTSLTARVAALEQLNRNKSI